MSPTAGCRCSAKNCNNPTKLRTTTLFRFPQEKERCRQWILNSGRKDLLQDRPFDLINKYCYLCSDHFEDRCFLTSEKKSLIPGAIPTVLKLSNPPQKPSTSALDLSKATSVVNHSPLTPISSLLKSPANNIPTPQILAPIFSHNQPKSSAANLWFQLSPTAKSSSISQSRAFIAANNSPPKTAHLSFLSTKAITNSPKSIAPSLTKCINNISAKRPRVTISSSTTQAQIAVTNVVLNSSITPELSSLNRSKKIVTYSVSKPQQILPISSSIQLRSTSAAVCITSNFLSSTQFISLQNPQTAFSLQSKNVSRSKSQSSILSVSNVPKLIPRSGSLFKKSSNDSTYPAAKRKFSATQPDSDPLQFPDEIPEVFVKDEPLEYNTCCYNLCYSNNLSDRLYAFPANPRLCKVWHKYTRTPDMLPNIHRNADVPSGMFLCEKHFANDQFLHQCRSNELKPDAVPSLRNSHNNIKAPLGKGARAIEQPSNPNAMCSAIHCKNKLCGDLSFFAFPTDEERCRQWILNSGRKDLLQDRSVDLISKYCYLCSDHFENRCFLNSEKMSLIPGAIPTILELPNSRHNSSAQDLSTATTNSSSIDQIYTVPTLLKSPECISLQIPPLQEPEISLFDPKSSFSFLKPRQSILPPSLSLFAKSSTDSTHPSAKLKFSTTQHDRNPPIKRKISEQSPPRKLNSLSTDGPQSTDGTTEVVIKDEPLEYNICCYSQCLSNNLSDQLFSFPANRRLLKEWLSFTKRLDMLQFVNRVGAVPKNLFLCERHFADDQFSHHRRSNRLKPDAVPRIRCKRRSIGTSVRVRATVGTNEFRDDFSDETEMLSDPSEKIHNKKVRVTLHQLQPASITWAFCLRNGISRATGQRCRARLEKMLGIPTKFYTPIKRSTLPPIVTKPAPQEEITSDDFELPEKDDRRTPPRNTGIVATQEHFAELDNYDRIIQELKQELKQVTKKSYSERNRIKNVGAQIRSAVRSPKLKRKRKNIRVKDALEYLKHNLSRPVYGFLRAQLIRDVQKIMWSVWFIEIPLVVLRCNINTATLLRQLFNIPCWTSLTNYKKKIRANPDLITNPEIVKHVCQAMKNDYYHRFIKDMTNQKKGRLRKVCKGRTCVGMSKKLSQYASKLDTNSVADSDDDSYY